jgi:cell division septation protein DedD
MTRAPLLAVLRMVSSPALFRTFGCLALLAALAACSGQAPRIDQTQEAVRYKAHARGNYQPPGSPEDPWRPYIVEASRKFDVPERWIREVMRVESGGQMYQNGSLITSHAGAMGLMQVMPETYDELQARYDLSDDAYDPHNNILAGTAYLREMYDIYGSPGFLAAYNAGPKRLDDYLANVRPLPAETRRYVAMIGPYVMDSAPANRSPAEQYAMNVLPTDIPPGLRYGGRTIQLAQARPTSGRAPRGSVRSSQLAENSRASAPTRLAAAEAPPPAPPPPGKHRGFNLIQPAMAEGVPTHRGGSSAGGWAVQVGAFSNAGQAHAAAGSAKAKASLGGAHSTVASVRQGHGTLYRARLIGLSRDSAVEACQKLSRSRTNCMVLSPDAQS